MNRAGALALQLSLLYAAVAAGMSRISLTHNSDTIIQALVSLVHWTPYYWGENRFGMFVPLLARPITDPAGNLIFQMVLIAWSAAIAVWLLYRLTEESAVAAMSCALTIPTLLLLFRQKAGFLVILQSTYIPPVTLLLVGWFVFTRKSWHEIARVAGLAIALLLSFWINVSNVVFIAVLALLWPGLSLQRRGVALGTIIATNVAATRIAALFPGQSFRELLPPGQWIGSLWRLLADASVNVVYLQVMALLLAGGAVVLAFRRRWDARLAIGLAACAQIGVVALSEWVSRNGSDSRYIVPPLFILAVMAAATIAYPASLALRRLQSQAAITALASLIVIAVATRAFGFPSPARAAAYLEEATRPAAEYFGDVPCTHLLGDYWKVWMAEYHDMLTGRNPVRQGVTFRSDAIRPFRDQKPERERQYCSACADPTIEFFRVQQQVPELSLTLRDGAACQWTPR